jgi:chemotaxis protein histidine kinase CheA
MTAPPGLPRLLDTFLEELDERVTALESDLLAIERTDDLAARTELAASVFRSIHSLKGASHAVGVQSWNPCATTSSRGSPPLAPTTCSSTLTSHRT